MPPAQGAAACLLRGIEGGQGRAYLMDDPSIYRERHMADPRDEEVARLQVGMLDTGVSLGNDQLVQIGPHGEHAGATPWGRLGELGDDVTADAHLPHDGVGHDACGHGACMGCAQGHQRMDLVIPAESLHEIATDEPAHGVTDDVDVIMSGLLADLSDEVAESDGHGSDVVGEGGVVEGVS